MAEFYRDQSDLQQECMWGTVRSVQPVTLPHNQCCALTPREILTTLLIETARIYMDGERKWMERVLTKN